jgi:predicted transglutaminase-like cysteine proteinase
MLRILLILLSFSFLYASNYPSFTKHELNSIKIELGNIAKNRAHDYDKTISSLKNIPKPKQLIKVNVYLNQLLPQVDMLNQHTIDYWETPKEFLTCGYGDCEDYAIIKYFTLIKLGFDKNKLFITTVHEKYSGGYHMVLSYFKEKNKPPLILDNLSFRILDLKFREDLKVDTFMNNTGSYKINRYNNLIKIGKAPDKFLNLLKRVKKEL